jgi:hypothetical protein
VKHRFAVSLARVTQDDSQHPGPTATPLRIDHRCSSAEINLHFLAGLDFDAPDPLGLPTPQVPHKPFDRLIGTGKPHFGYQVLVNALRTQPSVIRKENFF